MLHMRNPQRFLFLEKDSCTEICFPGDSCICLPTCILHSPPSTVQTLPKQGTQLPPPPPPLGLQKYSVSADRQLGSGSRRVAKHTIEKRQDRSSAPNLENKEVATDNHMQQCFHF